MNKLNFNKKEFNAEKIDKEFEALTLKMSMNSQNMFEYEADIYYFVSENFGLCGQLIQTLDFKNCYFIYKKNEKLLMMIFKSLQTYDQPKFPTKEIYLELTDTSKDVNSIDYNLIINQTIEKPLKDVILHEEKTITFFFEKMIRFLMFSINNSSVILLLRDKILNGWQNLIKLLFVRFKVINSQLAIFHIGILEMNTAYALFLMEKYDFANIFINRSLKNLEYLSKIEKSKASNQVTQKEDFVEKKTDLLCILEYTIFIKVLNEFDI